MTEFWIEGIRFGEMQEWVELLEQEASDTCMAYSPKQDAKSLIVEREREREVLEIWEFVLALSYEEIKAKTWPIEG